MRFDRGRQLATQIEGGANRGSIVLGDYEHWPSMLPTADSGKRSVEGWAGGTTPPQVKGRNVSATVEHVPTVTTTSAWGFVKEAGESGSASGTRGWHVRGKRSPSRRAFRHAAACQAWTARGRAERSAIRPA